LKKSKYAILFTDDATRHRKPDFLKRRDEAFEKIKDYIAWVEHQYGYTPKVLRVDNTKELTSEAVKAWLRSRGITMQNPAPYMHPSNGVVERFNQTIIELARAMLIALPALCHPMPICRLPVDVPTHANCVGIFG
jgi:transposase InsO family protein